MNHADTNQVDTNNVVLDKVYEASARWKSAFNSGDADGCAAQYEAEACMFARPMGTFTGSEAIREFWQNLITEGFADVQYIDPKFEILDERSVLLTSKWKMNKAAGVIHKELWVIQDDGSAKLREDDFEVLS